MSNVVQMPREAVYSKPSETELEDLLHEICYELGTRPLPFMRRELLNFACDWHIEPGLMYLALQSTLKAPRPTWVYFRAIICRCHAEGCTTEQQFAMRSLKHDSHKELPLY